MEWIPVERELPEDFQTVIISGECNGLRAVNTSFRKNGEWVKPFDWKPWNVSVEAWMPMPTIYGEAQRGPKGPPGIPGYLLHPWTGEEVYDFDVDKYLELFQKGEKGMSFEFQGFVQEGWMCPICKRVYSPATPMCWYCGGEQTTTVSTGTNVEDHLLIDKKKNSPKKCPWYQGVCGLNEEVVCYTDQDSCETYKDWLVKNKT